MTYPRVRKLYTPAEINEAVAALQQNTEIGLNEAQAMSIIKSLFTFGLRIIKVGKIENELTRVRRAKAGPQDREPDNGQQR